jgi:hypothetical protein
MFPRKAQKKPRTCKRCGAFQLSEEVLRVHRPSPEDKPLSAFFHKFNSASEKAATVATSATHERGNVAAVADVAASGEGATIRDNGEDGCSVR